MRASAFTILKRMARVSSHLNPVNSRENLYAFSGAARLRLFRISQSSRLMNGICPVKFTDRPLRKFGKGKERR